MLSTLLVTGYKLKNTLDIDIESILHSELSNQEIKNGKYYNILPDHVLGDKSNISLFFDYTSKKSYLIEKELSTLLEKNKDLGITLSKRHAITDEFSEKRSRLYETLKILKINEKIKDSIYKSYIKNNLLSNDNINLILLKNGIGTNLFREVYNSKDVTLAIGKSKAVAKESFYDNSDLVIINGIYHIDISEISTKNAMKIINYTLKLAGKE